MAAALEVLLLGEVSVQRCPQVRGCFRKLGVHLSGVLTIRSPSILGSISGPLIFGSPMEGSLAMIVGTFGVQVNWSGFL